MVQIAFLTLFLGLTSGPQAVELAVGGPVRHVELLLDGVPAARIAGPPWQTRIDFRSGLLPHELVARALDPAGREVGRSRQWINLPRSPAEVEVALEAGPDGRPRAARIAWQSLEVAAPQVRATLDGRPLAVGPDRRALLPEVDLAVAHVLSVEVRFSPTLAVERDLILGGGGGEVWTQLTAVPVHAAGGALPALGRLQGTLLAGGRALPVIAVEDAPARLIVVRDLATRDALRKLGSVGERPGYLRHDLELARDARMHLLWPTPRRVGEISRPAELFDTSPDFTARDGGLHWLLTEVNQPPQPAAGQRIADAVAVAGLQALSGNGPRAVLLVLGPGTRDASGYTPAEVRRYLAAIRAPLFVWSAAPPAATQGWGAVEDVSTLPNLRAALARLRRELETQQILWIDGLHLPQTITAAPGAGLELAGAAPPA